MSILFDIALIRQESESTCWFAASRMIKSYGIPDPHKRKQYIESSARLQRMDTFDGKSMSYQSDNGNKSWLYSKVLQGKRYKSNESYVQNNQRSTLLREQRPIATSVGGLNFYSAELDKYMEIEWLQKIKSHEMGSINKNPDLMQPADYKNAYQEFENALRTHGPLMCSILSTSRTSHAVVIAGVFQTKPGQSYPALFLPPIEFTPDSKEKNMTISSEYWVVINDPGGSMYSVVANKDVDTADEREHIKAEQYYMSIEEFLDALHADMDYYREDLKADVPEPNILYFPPNDKVQRFASLPAEEITNASKLNNYSCSLV